MLKEILGLYTGSIVKIRDHIHESSPIAEFARENTRQIFANQIRTGRYIDERSKYEGYLGISEEDHKDINLFIAGTAEILAKIVLIKKQELIERDVYNCSLISNAVTELSDFFSNITLKELYKLSEYLGEENLTNLNIRLDEGLVESFEIYQDNQINRAVWLFQLISFYKYKELKWFKFRTCLTHPLVKNDIERLARRIFDAFWPLVENKRVDYFPKYGRENELTAVADIQIEDEAYLISSRTQSTYTQEHLDREAIILNVCSWLSKDTAEIPIKKCFVYHSRWNAFTQVS